MHFSEGLSLHTGRVASQAAHRGRRGNVGADYVHGRRHQGMCRCTLRNVGVCTAMLHRGMQDEEGGRKWDQEKRGACDLDFLPGARRLWNVTISAPIFAKPPSALAWYQAPNMPIYPSKTLHDST